MNSLVLGAFGCLVCLVVLYDCALYAILRERFLLLQALRTLSVGLAALAMNSQAVAALGWDAAAAFPLQMMLTDIGLATLGPFLIAFVEAEKIDDAMRRAAERAALAAAACMPLAWLAYRSPLTDLVHFALLLASVSLSFSILFRVLRRGSRAARFLSAGMSAGFLIAIATGAYSLANDFAVPDTGRPVLVALTIEFLLSAAAVGDRLLIARAERDRAELETRDVTRQSLIDPLTGLPNRRALTQAFERIGPDKVPGGIALIDLDRFKGINDKFGHDMGDAVLIATARALGAGKRFAARLGGEEFVLVLYGRDWAKQAENARRSVELGVRSALPDLPRSVTATAGLAVYSPEETLSQTLKRADRALYAAKEAGRNRSLAMTFFAEPRAARPAVGTGRLART